MIENKNGSFGPVEMADDILKRFADRIPETVKAVHFGTKEELETLKENQRQAVLAHYQARIEELEKSVNKIMIHLGIDDRSEILIVGKMP
jgi:SAM-dependent MidA family methyltransferase